MTRITPKSLRIRLALFAALLLCLIQIILGLLFYSLTASWLQNQVDEGLKSTAAQFLATMDDSEGLRDDNLNFNTNLTPANQILQEQLFFIRVIDLQTGKIINTSTNYTLPVNLDENHTILPYETVATSGDNSQNVRLYTLSAPTAPNLAIQVGHSLKSVEQTQSQILRLLGIMLAATALLALGTGWVLADRALIPVNAITTTARDIGEHDLNRRIKIDLPNDELGRLAQTFNQMLDRIEEAFARQKRFTADAAHELRTPLSIMQTGIDVILGQTRTADQYRAAMENMGEEVQRLTQLTTYLLMLARVDDPNFALKRHPMDLSLLLNTVIDDISTAADQKHITIHRDISPNVTLSADENRLIQMVLNLLENAVKYTPEKGQITINLKSQPSAVTFTIADTGQGIPPEDLPHIFERFYRSDRARSRNQGGFGLGLAIAQQIVQLHKGTIQVSSQPGAGTQFIVTLPTS